MNIKFGYKVKFGQVDDILTKLNYFTRKYYLTTLKRIFRTFFCLTCKIIN